MSDVQVSFIVFGGGIALILMVYLVHYKYLIMEKKCNCKTKEIVKRYTFFNREVGS